MDGNGNLGKKIEPLSGLAWRLLIASFCRLVLNTSKRFAYPFAAVLSRGLGVPLPAITSLIAVNQATGLLGIFLGPLADRFGYRNMMLVGLAFMAAGMLGAFTFPIYFFVFLAFLMVGVGKSIFDPAIQAYVGHRVPYHRRGLVIGLLEVAWAGSTLVGVPLIGLLMQAYGWRSPFLVLGFLAILGFLALGFWLPKIEERSAVYQRIRFRDMLALLARERHTRGTLVFVFLVCAGNDNLFVVYGVWLEANFGLNILAVGLMTSVIGAAELAGEFLAAGFSDRLGLKRSIYWGLGITTIAYALLPVIGQTTFLALTGMFFLFFIFEFSMVAMMTLGTELLPQARATMMSSFMAAAGLGRVAGALMGGTLWLSGGITIVCLVSAGLNALALASLMWGLKGWQNT